MMLFSRFSEDLGRGQEDCPLMANCVGEIGSLPLHNSERGHSRLSSGDLCRRCEILFGRATNVAFILYWGITSKVAAG
jgi:hypothetical protein